MKSTTRVFVALVTVLALTAACGNSKGTESTATTAAGEPSGPTTTADLTKNVHLDGVPGVTDSTIRIAGVAAKTNPIGVNFGHAFEGTKAYFAMVNANGGIYGRKLELVSEHDDQTAKNQSEVDAILAQDNAFAIAPLATILFTGAQELADKGVPTFGWNIQDDWAKKTSLFGEKGSYLCISCAAPTWPWVAQQMSRHKVAILAYGVQQSKDCAEGWRKSIVQYGGDTKVAFFDNSLPYGVPDLSGDVKKMKDKGVNLIMTCMDQNGVVTLAKEVRRQNLDAPQFLPNAYDPQFAKKFGKLFEGSLVGIQFWPFEEKTNQPQGMKDYQKWIEKVGGPKDEISMAGWLSADLLYQGLKGAGPEFDRQKVVDAINRTKRWDANGLNAGFDWTIAHEHVQPDSCFAIVEVHDGHFTPKYGKPGKPFVCLSNNTKTLPEAEIRS